jgi:hypothetical protein
LKSAARIDADYRELSADIIKRAVKAAAEGKTRSITALQTDLVERDRRLGGQRPDVLSSTLAALRQQYDVAAKVQLLRDQRASSVDTIRNYVADIDAAIKRFDEIRKDFQRVDDPIFRPALRDALEFVKRTLLRSSPPPEVAEAHGLLLTAVALGESALEPMSDPRIPPDMARAMRASAVSESLSMFDRGKQAIGAALRAH